MKKPIVAITENREIRMPNMMLNMPNRISPMIPTTKPPAQKAMFDVAVTTADNAFHNTFPMSLNIILIFSDFRLLITLFGFGVGGFFFYGTHALPISICIPVIRSNSRLYLAIRFSSNTFSSIPTFSGL